MHKQTERKQAKEVESGVLGLSAGGNDAPKGRILFHISGIYMFLRCCVLAAHRNSTPLCVLLCYMAYRKATLYTKKRGNRLPPFPRVEVFALPVFLRSGNAKPTPICYIIRPNTHVPAVGTQHRCMHIHTKRRRSSLLALRKKLKVAKFLLVRTSVR